MMKDQPVPLAKDYEKLKGKLEHRKRDAPGLSQLQGKAVRIYMRGGLEIEDSIVSVQTYESEVEGILRRATNTTNIITNEKKRYIIIKHAVDMIETI